MKRTILFAAVLLFTRNSHSAETLDMQPFLTSMNEIFRASLYCSTILFVSVLLVGFGFAFLGYRLFEKGILVKDGELTAEGFDVKVALKRAAPGTFFALFGCGIIITMFALGAYDIKQSAANVAQESAGVASTELEKQADLRAEAVFKELMNAPDFVRFNETLQRTKVFLSLSDDEDVIPIFTKLLKNIEISDPQRGVATAWISNRSADILEHRQKRTNASSSVRPSLREQRTNRASSGSRP